MSVRVASDMLATVVRQISGSSVAELGSYHPFWGCYLEVVLARHMLDPGEVGVVRSLRSMGFGGHGPQCGFCTNHVRDQGFTDCDASLRLRDLWRMEGDPVEVAGRPWLTWRVDQTLHAAAHVALAFLPCERGGVVWSAVCTAVDGDEDREGAILRVVEMTHGAVVGL